MIISKLAKFADLIKTTIEGLQIKYGLKQKFIIKVCMVVASRLAECIIEMNGVSRWGNLPMLKSLGEICKFTFWI